MGDWVVWGDGAAHISYGAQTEHAIRNTRHALTFDELGTTLLPGALCAKMNVGKVSFHAWR